MSSLVPPAVPQAVVLGMAIYARHAAGCCLHSVIDDGNLGDGSIRYCAQHAEHDECVALAQLLLGMSWSQRRRAVARMHGYPSSKQRRARKRALPDAS